MVAAKVRFFSFPASCSGDGTETSAHLPNSRMEPTRDDSGPRAAHSRTLGTRIDGLPPLNDAISTPTQTTNDQSGASLSASGRGGVGGPMQSRAAPAPPDPNFDDQDGARVREKGHRDAAVSADATVERILQLGT